MSHRIDIRASQLGNYRIGAAAALDPAALRGHGGALGFEGGPASRLRSSASGARTAGATGQGSVIKQRQRAARMHELVKQIRLVFAGLDRTRDLVSGDKNP
jgi:hypothetical protein